ncbi:MAG: hypothetical protein WD044_14540 [Dongiaceae bacterium]
MTWADWIPAISTSTLLGIAGFILGTYYKARTEKGIQHKFDRRLEELRAKLRQDEEDFRANLRRKDEELAAIRSGALSGLFSRNATLDERRLKAAEAVWSAVVNLGKFKALAELSKGIKMDAAIDAAAQGDQQAQKMQKFSETILNAFELGDLKLLQMPDKERLFIPPMIWAHFTAYKLVVFYPYAQFTAMRTGMGQKMLSHPKEIADVVKSVLSQATKVLDEHGPRALPYFVEPLENELLDKLIGMISPEAVDENAIKQAAKITAVANRTLAVEGFPVEIPDWLQTNSSI